MKKGFLNRTVSLFMGLCMALLCLPEGALNVEAATGYALYVNGEQVTSSNASNILGNGNFRYVDSTKTLYIKGYNDFSYEERERYLYCRNIYNKGIAGLTICTEGDCTIAGYIDCDESTTITGSYPLKIDNVNHDGFKITNSSFAGCILADSNLVKITIQNADVTTADVIRGNMNYNTSLAINNSNVTATNGINSFNKGVTLTNCYVKSNSTVGTTGISGSPVVIAKGTAPVIKDYGFSIADVDVTSLNADDIRGDGKFTYNASTNTLTIDGASCQYSIFNKTNSGLIIKTVSESKIGCLLLDADTTLTGSGKLYISTDNILSTFSAVVTIKDANLVLKYLRGDSKGTLKIINSNVTANEISGFAGGITLTNCYIKSPSKSYIDGPKIVGGSTDPIVIVPGTDPNPYAKYGFKVDGITVDSENAADILGDGIFKYDPSSKTLTINGSEKVTITNETCTGLIVKPLKNSEIGSLYVKAMTRLTGDPDITLKSANTTILYNTLHISNLNFDTYSIAGYSDEASLVIDTAAVSTKHNGISNIKGGIVMTKCKIMEPEDAVIKDGTIFNADGIKLNSVLIDNPDAYYNFSYNGTKVTSHNYEQLFGDAATYDKETNTLTVTGYLKEKLENYGNSGLVIDIQEGSSRHGDVGTYELNLSQDTVITGTGVIYNIDVTDDANLTFRDAVISITSSLTGQKYESINIINSDLSIRLQFWGFESGITLDGSVLCKPANGEIKDGAVRVDGSAQAGVEFEATGEPYGLFIGDRQVTSRNCDDVFHDGKVKYNSSAKVLYIGADLDLSECKNPTIRNVDIDGLQIYDNNGDVDNFILKGGFDIQANTTFKNPILSQYNLTVIPAEGQDAVKVSKGAKLTLNCASFTADGAIAGSATGEQLEVKYSTVTAKSSDGVKSAVNGFSGGITLEECAVASPEGGDVFGAAILDKDENPILDELMIRKIKKYGLSINSVQVTEDNYTDIESLFTKSLDAASKIAEGERFAFFDPDTETLTLKDVDIETDTLTFSGVNLNIEGDVKFCSNIAVGLVNTLTITGSGTLTCTDNEKGYISAILGGSIEIRETTVNAEIKGIAADKLSIFDSNITAPKIGTFTNGITVEECTIVSPNKAVVDTVIYNSDGSTVAENIVIKRAHVHTEKIELVEKVDATCETDGNIAYYQCSCGRKFADEEAETELTDAEIVIPATGHSLKHIEAKDPTCEEDGNTEYYLCEACGRKFEDEEATEEIFYNSYVTLWAIGHDYDAPVYIWSKDFTQITATCTCKNDATHIISETVKATITDIEGGKVYTAEFTDAHFTTQTFAWTAAVYTVTLNANGGEGAAVKSSVISGSSFTFPACTFTAPEGKKFTGWLIGEKLYQPGDSLKITKNITAKAQWTDIIYTVVFDANGGSGEMETITVAPNTAVTLPKSTFTAPEYTKFIGWLIGEKTYEAGEKVTITADTVIQALWSEPELPAEKITVGDVDGDGKVDTKDAMMLSRYVGGWEGIVLDMNAADLDRDGKVDVRDAMILSRYAAAWDGYDKYIIEVEK